MQYIFTLGSNPDLSIAEISAFFNNKKINLLNNNILILESEKELDVNNIIKKLGGTIKIGLVEKNIINDREEIIKTCEEIIDQKIEKNNSTGKFHFGLSYYSSKKNNIKPIAMEIKKYLRSKKISCRWVDSRDSILSSVVVEQNKLLKNGIEIIIIKNNNRLIIGKTLAVQPFKKLSFRDYGRPARDDKSGMIPPKLALIMLNLAQVEHKDIILDPFCGSGTIITEAMLCGYKNIIGSDISQKAINDTNENIKWTKNNFDINIANIRTYNQPADKISKNIKPNSINAIITEPYLGPQRGKINIQKTISELEKLYTNALIEFKKILKSDGKIVMIWPCFVSQDKKDSCDFINPKINGYKIININNNKTTSNRGIIYGREGQKVWREIVVLKLYEN